MSKLSRLASDQRGDALRPFAVTAGVIAFASLALTTLLDHATRNGTLPQIAFISPSGDSVAKLTGLRSGATQMAAGAYDDMPVGSIAGRSVPPIVLDPCTGKTR